MKCIEANGGNVIRVTNEEAAKKVDLGWRYVPKWAWKSYRDFVEKGEIGA